MKVFGLGGKETINVSDRLLGSGRKYEPLSDRERRGSSRGNQKMATVLRGVGAIGAGMVVAAILVVGLELFSAVVHPVPADFQGTEEEMCAHVERIPQWVLAVAVASWGATALAGTWTAGRLGNGWCALVVGLLLLGAAILNLSMLPYPIWFKVANLIAIPAAIAAGMYLSRRREAGAVKAIDA
jgi:hypothetical protein